MKKADQVRERLEEIALWRHRGSTWAEVAAALNADGLSVSADEIRAYWGRFTKGASPAALALEMLTLRAEKWRDEVAVWQQQRLDELAQARSECADLLRHIRELEDLRQVNELAIDRHIEQEAHKAAVAALEGERDAARAEAAQAAQERDAAKAREQRAQEAQRGLEGRLAALEGERDAARAEAAQAAQERDAAKAREQRANAEVERLKPLADGRVHTELSLGAAQRACAALESRVTALEGERDAERKTAAGWSAWARELLASYEAGTLDIPTVMRALQNSFRPAAS